MYICVNAERSTHQCTYTYRYTVKPVQSSLSSFRPARTHEWEPSTNEREPMHAPLRVCIIPYMSQALGKLVSLARVCVCSYNLALMMIAFITFNNSLVPLIEGLWSSIPWEFELSGFKTESNRRPRDWQSLALTKWATLSHEVVVCYCLTALGNAQFPFQQCICFV